MSDLDEIKSRINILDLVGARVKLKKAGRNYKGLCPFHSEKTPSFMVNPDRNTWHCFGCGKGGSVFDFVMEFERVDFVEALETLAEKAGVILTRRPSDTPEAKLKEQLYAVNHLASEYYHYLLTKHALGDSARNYLKGRQISDKSQVTFSLGYSPNSWDGLCKYLTKKGFTGEVMEKAGLLIRGSRGYYDRFRGRLMFPLKTHRGLVAGFSGRVLSPDDQEAKYINTSETLIYQKSELLYGLDVTKAAIQKANEVILMEGELDVISSFQAGVGNAVAIKGSAVTEAHVRLVKRFAERLVFALDADVAGETAIRRGLEVAEPVGLELKVLTLPRGLDPDELAREQPALLKKAVLAAEPAYDYLINTLTGRHDLSSAFGQKKAGEELVPILARIDNPIVAGHYLKKFATTIGASEQVVEESLRKYEKNQKTQVFPRAEASDRDKMSHNLGMEEKVLVASREDKLLLQILALLLQGSTRDWFEDFTDQRFLTHVSEPGFKQIFVALSEWLAREPGQFFARDFLNSLPPELLPMAEKALLVDFSLFSEGEEALTREWQATLGEFKLIAIKREIKRVSGQLAKTGDDEAAAGKLQTELTELTESLKSLDSPGWS